MSNVSVEFCPSVSTLLRPDLLELLPALIAVVGSQMVFCVASTAVRRQLATGHGNERPGIAVDDLQVAYHKTGIKSDAAKSAQPVLGRLHQLDSDFRNLHPVLRYPASTKAGKVRS